MSCPSAVRRSRSDVSASAARAAAFSVATMAAGVPFGAQRPCQAEK
jgi:hypothetical protein